MCGTHKQMNYTNISSPADASLLGYVDGLESAPWLMSSLADFDLNWFSWKALAAS